MTYIHRHHHIQVSNHVTPSIPLKSKSFNSPYFSKMQFFSFFLPSFFFFFSRHFQCKWNGDCISPKSHKRIWNVNYICYNITYTSQTVHYTCYTCYTSEHTSQIYNVPSCTTRTAGFRHVMDESIHVHHHHAVIVYVNIINSKC